MRRPASPRGQVHRGASEKRRVARHAPHGDLLGPVEAGRPTHDTRTWDWRARRRRRTPRRRRRGSRATTEPPRLGEGPEHLAVVSSGLLNATTSARTLALSSASSGPASLASAGRSPSSAATVSPPSLSRTMLRSPSVPSAATASWTPRRAQSRPWTQGVDGPLHLGPVGGGLDVDTRRGREGDDADLHVVRHLGEEVPHRGAHGTRAGAFIEPLVSMTSIVDRGAARRRHRDLGGLPSQGSRDRLRVDRRCVVRPEDEGARAPGRVAGPRSLRFALSSPRRLGAPRSRRQRRQGRGLDQARRPDGRSASSSGTEVNIVGWSSMPRSARSCVNLGLRPVLTNWPRNRPASSRPAEKSKVNRSWRVMTSPSMPTTSVIATIRREPSLRRACWMMRSSAPATCSRMARTGRSTPCHEHHGLQAGEESRGLLACTVVIDPS